MLFSLPAYNPVDGTQVTNIRLSGEMAPFFTIDVSSGKSIFSACKSSYFFSARSNITTVFSSRFCRIKVRLSELLLVKEVSVDELPEEKYGFYSFHATSSFFFHKYNSIILFVDCVHV